jgi:hypothetical protein
VRYRLDVVAATVADAVAAAGGWMFDRVMAGWDVRVMLADAGDVRPLEILGAEIADLETELVHGPAGTHPNALAVAGELYGSDARIREGVRQALEHGGTEVTLWGDFWPSELDRSVGSVEHRLTVAAKAFKSQALAAANTTAEPGSVETFRSAALCFPVVADLVPA